MGCFRANVLGHVSPIGWEERIGCLDSISLTGQGSPMNRQRSAVPINRFNKRHGLGRSTQGDPVAPAFFEIRLFEIFGRHAVAIENGRSLVGDQLDRGFRGPRFGRNFDQSFRFKAREIGQPLECWLTRLAAPGVNPEVMRVGRGPGKGRARYNDHPVCP